MTVMFLVWLWRFIHAPCRQN